MKKDCTIDRTRKACLVYLSFLPARLTVCGLWSRTAPSRLPLLARFFEPGPSSELTTDRHAINHTFESTVGRTVRSTTTPARDANSVSHGRRSPLRQVEVAPGARSPVTRVLEDGDRLAEPRGGLHSPLARRRAGAPTTTRRGERWWWVPTPARLSTLFDASFSSESLVPCCRRREQARSGVI